jgi:hypothetical protein
MHKKFYISIIQRLCCISTQLLIISEIITQMSHFNWNMKSSVLWHLQNLLHFIIKESRIINKIPFSSHSYNLVAINYGWPFPYCRKSWKMTHLFKHDPCMHCHMGLMTANKIVNGIVIRCLSCWVFLSHDFQEFKKNWLFPFQS